MDKPRGKTPGRKPRGRPPNATLPGRDAGRVVYCIPGRHNCFAASHEGEPRHATPEGSRRRLHAYRNHSHARRRHVESRGAASRLIEGAHGRKGHRAATPNARSGPPIGGLRPPAAGL